MSLYLQLIEASDQLFGCRWGSVTLNGEVDNLDVIEDALLSPESVYDDVSDLLVAFKIPQLPLFTSVVELNLILPNPLALFIILITL